MSESKITKIDRRNLVGFVLGGVTGTIGSLFVGEAQAQDGGAAATQLVILVQKFNEYRQQFKETTGFITGIRDTVKSGIDSYFEWTQDLWELNDQINGIMTAAPGLGTQIKDLPKDIVNHVQFRIAEVEALGKAYDGTSKFKPNTRYGLAFRTRARAGRALAEAAATATREKYVNLANRIEKLTGRQKNKGEMFATAAAPIAMEQNQLILETLLRIEQRLDRMLQMESSQEFHEPVKAYTTKDFQKSLEGMKKGKGTLIDDGEKT